MQIKGIEYPDLGREPVKWVTYLPNKRTVYKLLASALDILELKTTGFISRSWTEVEGVER